MPRLGVLLCVLGVLCGEKSFHAQLQMPDAREMSGIPRPVTDLPPGVVSVRLIRGDLSNNIPNHPVELHIGDEVRRASTGGDGRAEFRDLRGGAMVKAVAVVDGERLESETFPAPSQGGIRLMLVATDKEKEARAAEEANRPAIAGEVIIGRASQIVIEPDEELVRVYYLLEIVNTARAPVSPARPMMFDVPSGALNTTILEGSSPQASATGPRVRVLGPFPPGRTVVQVAYALPAPGGSVELSQAFPSDLEQLAVVVKKTGDAALSSPQIARQQEMPSRGETFIAAAGEGTIPAGTPFTLSITGLPHHSPWPRRLALLLAGGIVVAGVVASRRTPGSAPGEEGGQGRSRLIARREKLFQELVKLEHERRRGGMDAETYARRRERLVSALEQVYAALDDEGSGTGVAA
jgi:hypothetical protein